MKNPKSVVALTICIVLLTGNINSLSAQYPPPAGQSGTTAIHADSNVFVAWANECFVERGFADISMTGLGHVTYGIEGDGTDKANNAVVSLGDGGIATLHFNVPICNGPGWDFAVFENSFLDDFLELAFVEVSSNGIDYHRFSSISLTQQDTQVETFGLIDATKIHNLAGKYRAMYGTPFDLWELKGIARFDLSNIISVRIVDVVGSIDSNYATCDSEGRTVNDPWPTPFETGGFDLDAVGVIHNRDNTSIGKIFPNPVKDCFYVSLNDNINKVAITDMSGNPVLEHVNPPEDCIDVQSLPKGLYIVKIYCEEKLFTAKLIKI